MMGKLGRREVCSVALWAKEDFGWCELLGFTGLCTLGFFAVATLVLLCKSM